ncbi:MAG: response regulator [Bdellovibrionales bacterium]
MGTKPTILIVDDDKVSLALLQKLVEKLDYDAVSASDGEEAMRVMGTQQVDLIISDYEMPKMNGLELLINTRAEYPRVPFILVTAYSNLAVIREAWANGAFDFFQKPVYVDRLQQTIRLAIEYGHLTIARRKFNSSEASQPNPQHLNAGVIRELAAALERDDLLRIVEEFETHARIELEQVFRFSMIKDSAQVKTFAHRLAGTATNLGLVGISDQMKAIESNPEAPLTNVNELALELEMGIHWLKTYLTQIYQDLAV